MGRCFTIEYVMPMNMQLKTESTVSVLSESLCSLFLPGAAHILHSGLGGAG